MSAAVATAPQAMAPKYTCTTCLLAFPANELQRLHMKTDLHRYNLKRKVASLPPISADVFAEKVLQQQQATQQGRERLRFEATCVPCGNKRFTSQGAYENHLSSAKHRKSTKEFEARGRKVGSKEDRNSVDRESSLASSTISLGEPVVEVTDDDRDSVGQDARSADERSGISEEHVVSITQTSEKPPTLSVKDCLFCSTSFPTLDDNVTHMRKVHGLFIPERSYLRDIEGLIMYLEEKVNIGNMCLACYFEGRSTASTKDHMLAKQHCKIPFESERDQLEISDFYDFTLSYPDARTAHHTAEEGEEGWTDEEEDDDGGSVTSEEVDEDVSRELIMPTEEYELELPSGTRVGHRSLARYYRQSLRPLTERQSQQTVIAASSEGLLRARDPPALVKAKKEAQKDIKKHQNVAMRRERRNINNQKHYRDELLQ